MPHARFVFCSTWIKKQLTWNGCRHWSSNVMPWYFPIIVDVLFCVSSSLMTNTALSTNLPWLRNIKCCRVSRGSPAILKFVLQSFQKFFAVLQYILLKIFTFLPVLRCVLSFSLIFLVVLCFVLEIRTKTPLLLQSFSKVYSEVAIAYFVPAHVKLRCLVISPF